MRGGGICLEDSLEDPALNNMDSRMHLLNSIVWENYAVWGSEILLSQSDPSYYPPVISLRYSDIKGGTDGIVIETEGRFSWSSGNLKENPDFAAPGIGDFHLNAGSPCIDAADSTPASEYDLEKRERYDDPAAVNKGIGFIKYVDIGALEYIP
jgi:hypothetical protein